MPEGQHKYRIGIAIAIDDRTTAIRALAVQVHIARFASGFDPRRASNRARNCRCPVVDGYSDPGITRLGIRWDRVPMLLLDPLEIPDSALVQGLNTIDGSLVAWGPGKPTLLTLHAWRGTIRVQQVAFTLAKALTEQWFRERGDAIPAHRLFPQLLGYTRQFLASRIECRGDRTAQEVAINPYFQRAVASLNDAMEPFDPSGAGQERPIVAAGPAGLRSTRFVEFHTGRAPSPVQKCHLNAAVYDTQTWEQAAAFALDSQASVRRWVKNDHLGFVVPYRKEGVRRNYLPDFIVEMVDGRRLIIEIKGADQNRDADIKAAAAERWCTAVNNDGRFGPWTYHLVRDPAAIGAVLR